MMQATEERRPTLTQAEQEESGASRREAREIADYIEAYWAERGHAVRCKLEHLPFTPAMRTAPWVVRSDMINGLPRQRFYELRGH